MIRIENVETVGWEHAIRGMRNPKNSWDKSDTVYGTYWGDIDGHKCFDNDGFTLGNNDFDLMKRLRDAGTDHRKFMRMITVYLDITAPLYWWKEFDTYKVGTVANSCSTMHKIHDRDLTLDDFSHEHIKDFDGFKDEVTGSPSIGWFEVGMQGTIDQLNLARKLYSQTGDKQYWWQMIQLLPSSYNQKRTVMLNYEVLANMYKSRKNHKLDEWRTLCEWIETLPYAELITGGTE